MMDEDLQQIDREALVAEVKPLRAGIRAHRDSSGHDLCWHHPQLWGLLPGRIEPKIAVPPWPKVLRGCLKDRESLDRQASGAAINDREYDQGRRYLMKINGIPLPARQGASYICRGGCLFEVR